MPSTCTVNPFLQRRELRCRESHDADDLPPTPSTVTLPPCSLCPPVLPGTEGGRSEYRLQQHRLLVRSRGLRARVRGSDWPSPYSDLLSLPYPPQLSTPPASPDPPACLPNLSRSSPPRSPQPLCAILVAHWTTNRFLPSLLSHPTPNMKPVGPFKNMNPGKK